MSELKRSHLAELKNGYHALPWYKKFLFPSKLRVALEEYTPDTPTTERAWAVCNTFLNNTWFFQRWFFSCLSRFAKLPLADNLRQFQKAAERLSARPDHLSYQVIDEAIVESYTQRVSNYATKLYFFEHGNEGRTGHPVLWRPSHQYLTTLHINDHKTEPAGIFDFYSHQLPQDKHCHYISAYNTSDASSDHPSLSKGKLCYSIGESALHVCQLNSFTQYRLGSTLMQIAVELSLEAGFEGRVELVSTRLSGPFYFKLGFLPRSQSVLEKLENSEKYCDGHEMYLPDAAICAWKKKISAHPILASSKSQMTPTPPPLSQIGARLSGHTFFNRGAQQQSEGPLPSYHADYRTSPDHGMNM